MKTLNSKDKAPHFELKDQNGHNVALSDFTGKRLFLYFYPKANTSG
jgi:peroxiredoxin Q/BCP